MYPGVVIEYDDQSNIPVKVPVTEVRNAPLFGAVFTSDKGPEDWMRVSGKEFFTLYGDNISFKKHGQPLLQAAMTINAGAELFCKRLVADDARLANALLVAKIDENGFIKEIPAGDVYTFIGYATYNGKLESIYARKMTIGVLSMGDQEQLQVTFKSPDVTTSACLYTIKGYEGVYVLHQNVFYPITDSGVFSAVYDENTHDYNRTLLKASDFNYDETDPENSDYYAIYYYEATNYFIKLPETDEYVEITDMSQLTDILSNQKSIKYDWRYLDSDITVDNINDYCDKEELIPLYLFTDVGRGVSNKRIKIIPNYKVSKSLDYVLYTISILEGTKELESFSFSVNPDLVLNGENISLSSIINNHSKQIKCLSFDENIKRIALSLNESELDVDNLYNKDILFVKNNNGSIIDGITITSDSVNLNNTAGLALMGGYDGSFGDCPFNSNQYASVAVKAIGATVENPNDVYDKIIFDVDSNKLVAFVDANYPTKVKDALSTLADFREDFVFFRDQGLGKTSLDAVKKDFANQAVKSKFVATYCQSYDIIDPYTKKTIPVTIGYSLAQRLVEHCNNGAILPTAGIKYSMTIPEAIFGTLSYAPTNLPEAFGGDEKEALTDLHINYASYVNNQLTIETLFTSQEESTQWSYINNVMGIQEVIRDIRNKCPVIRYTFIDGEDLERYKADIEEVIAPHQSKYKSLEVEFLTDSTYAANKIFYAALKVNYKDFVQTEWFKITALSSATAAQN